MLTYHIIFVCKYRKKLLTKYGEDIKQIMFDISKKYDFEKTVPRNPRSL
jgi:putative transposase